MPKTRNTSKTRNKHAVHHSSKSDDWATPQAFFDRLDAEFGGMGLDVCASRTNHKAPQWYGLDHPDPSRRDALTQDWVADSGGKVCWMNAPYGKHAPAFMAKAVKAAQLGATVVCLMPARTDTRWWHSSIHEADVSCEVRFVKGRLKFGGAKNAAPFPSAVIILGPRAGKSWSAMRAIEPTASSD